MDWKRINLLQAQDLAGIGQASQNIVPLEARVVLQNIFFAPTLGQQAENELDRQAGPLDDGLPREYVRVYNDSALPSH
jgi:hypothetical protein